jgi:hypothetical protein
VAKPRDEIVTNSNNSSERGWSNAARMRQCEAGCFMRETNRFFGPAHASSHGRERIGPPPPLCPSVHNLVARVSYSVSSSLLLSSLLSLPPPLSLSHTQFPLYGQSHPVLFLGFKSLFVVAIGIRFGM